MLNLLTQYRDAQLECWPLARENYTALGHVERRVFSVGALTGALQFNPARAVSTGASVDKDMIAKRPCFLCRSNRPGQQMAEEIIPGWEFLVNPYPIFPLHFTIASTSHIPQSQIPLEMASMAEKLRGMTVFYNGSRAGASAPDHLHCQAVMTSELPLMVYLESGNPVEELPFKVCYRIITPDQAGMAALAELTDVGGIDPATGLPDKGLVNAFMWLGEDGLLRVCCVPRKAHRPSFYSNDSRPGFMVSPGSIDMAGIIILPRKIDFDGMSEETVKRLYNEVACGDEGRHVTEVE